MTQDLASTDTECVLYFIRSAPRAGFLTTSTSKTSLPQIIFILDDWRGQEPDKPRYSDQPSLMPTTITPTQTSLSARVES